MAASRQSFIRERWAKSGMLGSFLNKFGGAFAIVSNRSVWTKPGTKKMSKNGRMVEKIGTPQT